MTESVEIRLAVHESVCAERYNNIDRSLRDGDKRMTKIETLLYILIVAVLLGPGAAASLFSKLFGL